MNIQQLALDFAKSVREALGENLAEVVRRNRVEPDRSICHSHDFCDPYQCMIDALAEQGEEFSLFDEEKKERVEQPGVDDAMDTAWLAAKRGGFDEDKIPKDKVWLES